MSNTKSSFIDNLVTAARENPLAAALIGGGALWLLAVDQKLKTATRSAVDAVSPVADAGTSPIRSPASAIKQTVAPPTAPEMDDEGSLGVGETLRGATAAASDVVSGAADRVQDRFDEGVAFFQDTLGTALPGKGALSAQSSITELLERQPLVLGIVGMAIGAAVAGAFRASEIENEYIGKVADDVKADLNRRAGAVSQALRGGSDTVVAEVGDKGAEALDRVKQVGMDAAEAATAKVRSPQSG